MGDENSPAEALARAGVHARRAAVEALAALSALIEAGGRASLGSRGEEHDWVQPALRSLEQLRRALEDEEERKARDVLAAVLAAIEQQIAHWERESEGDPAARSVLRAFLAVRELLWEFGVRSKDEASESTRSFTRVPVDSA